VKCIQLRYPSHLQTKWFLISLFNFTELIEGGRAVVDQRIAEKAVIMSQHIFGVATPLGIATAYHIFNQTRSKSLVMLNNRLGFGISYERLQRQLTAESEKVMQQVETDGVYVPETMTKNCKIQGKKLTVANWVFAQTTHVDAAICGLACRVVFGR